LVKPLLRAAASSVLTSARVLPLRPAFIQVSGVASWANTLPALSRAAAAMETMVRTDLLKDMLNSCCFAGRRVVRDGWRFIDGVNCR